MIKIGLYVLLFICFSFQSYAQQDKENEIDILITQVVLPGSNPEIQYLIKSNKIRIIKNASYDKFRIFKTKTVYRNKLKKETVDSLIHTLNQIDFLSLKHHYFGGYLDGVTWTFKIKWSDRENEIILDNYYLPELDTILNIINNSLPNRKRYIRLDVLGFKDDYLNTLNNH